MPNPTLSDRMDPGRESWRPQRDASDAGPLLRRAALIMVGVACVGAVAGAGTMLLRGHRHGVPVIEADRSPVRVKPDNPGGMQISGEEEQIMDGGKSAAGDVMAPGPEVPAPQLLAAEIQAAHPAPPVAATAPPVAPAPAPPPAVAMDQPPAVPAPVTPPAPAPVRAPAPPAGSVEVQLAAMTTHDGAVAEWARLAKKVPELLGSRRSDIVQTELDGKTFYRVRTGGFADAAAAAAFCSQMHDKGAACAITRS